ncbi:APC family permease [Streptomyces sp. NPDC032161]|uniref:APC family permease n=1 Tax=unclassified Streptomyces TaxID=2593676 RepID=UPI0033D30539
MSTAEKQTGQQPGPRTGSRGAAHQQADGLAHRSVSTFEVGAQSVANVAPSAVIAFAPASMAASAGNGAWFSFFLAMAAVLAIAYCICVFARRRAGVGSLYAFSRLSLGAPGSFVTGWALLIGAVCIGSGSLAGAGYYTARALDQIGIGLFTGVTGQILLDVLLAAVAVRLTIASVRTAARVASVLEVVSIVLIVVVLLPAFFKSGNVIDTDQLSLSGSTLDGIVFAVVLGVLGFVGFEGAASLGAEATDPYKAIPRSVMGSAVLAGVLYMFATYAQVAGFGGADALGKSSDPMDELAEMSGLGFLKFFLHAGFAASFVAVVMACVTVAARLLFGMANEGVMPARLGVAHPRHRTPSAAIWAVTPFIALPAVLVVGAGTAPLDATTYIDTIGVFGYMLSYTLVCLAAPLFVRRIGARGLLLTWGLGLIGAAAMIYVFYRNLWPVPEWPLNVLPYVFVGALVLGVVGFAVLRVRKPEVAERAGTFADDLD